MAPYVLRKIFSQGSSSLAASHSDPMHLGWSSSESGADEEAGAVPVVVQHGWLSESGSEQDAAAAAPESSADFAAASSDVRGLPNAVDGEAPHDLNG